MRKCNYVCYHSRVKPKIWSSPNRTYTTLTNALSPENGKAQQKQTEATPNPRITISEISSPDNYNR